MVFNDELCRITSVRDLYTIGFDGVNVLGLQGLFDAKQDKEEKEFSHIMIWLGFLVVKSCCLFLFV
jgi:hypothetical protein